MTLNLVISGNPTLTLKVEIPQLTQLGSVLMSKFDDIMAGINDVKTAFDAFEARETAEDAEAEALKAQVADLQNQLATASANALTDDQVATLQAELAALKARADAQDQPGA